MAKRKAIDDVKAAKAFAPFAKEKPIKHLKAMRKYAAKPNKELANAKARQVAARKSPKKRALLAEIMGKS